MQKLISASNVWLPLLLTILAGISTGIGSLIPLSVKKFKISYLQFFLGLSAGVMVYVAFAELLTGAINNIGFLKANLAFFGGIISIMMLDFIIPHEYIEEHAFRGTQDKKLMSAGVFIALGITIHNFPEGLGVFMSSLGNLKLGIAMAFAIALHNIPEGIAVSLPIFYATKSKKKAFWYSFLSGAAEPIGAIVGILILMPFLTDGVLSFSLAFVAGVMVFISFDELLPLAYKDQGSHRAILGLVLGMLVMALSLCLF